MDLVPFRRTCEPGSAARIARYSARSPACSQVPASGHVTGMMPDRTLTMSRACRVSRERKEAAAGP